MQSDVPGVTSGPATSDVRVMSESRPIPNDPFHRPSLEWGLGSDRLGKPLLPLLFGIPLAPPCLKGPVVCGSVDVGVAMLLLPFVAMVGVLSRWRATRIFIHQYYSHASQLSNYALWPSHSEIGEDPAFQTSVRQLMCDYSDLHEGSVATCSTEWDAFKVTICGRCLGLTWNICKQLEREVLAMEQRPLRLENTVLQDPSSRPLLVKAHNGHSELLERL
ncbi:hypothetical protein NDU88_008937 [Pleurodeles waltl]|uniref:Uncharacterized protein n=1 Tax=Pleurodeles waltl TaxID=8319 RepID=A0AAV7RZL1_PLEWA|nr:hypothetical protein NDU88_008937 [Pleurodeles waltl]